MILHETACTPFDLLKRLQQVGRVNSSPNDVLTFITHELRTPVAATIGWTNILKMDRADYQLQGRALAVTERNARMQEYLINELSEITSLERESVRLQFCPFEVAATISDMVESIWPLARAKDIRLSAEYWPATGLIQGDKMRLQQVFANLLNNAIKFTQPGGYIAVSVRRLVHYHCCLIRSYSCTNAFL